MIGVFVPWSNYWPASSRYQPGYVIDGNGCHIWVGGCRNGYAVVRTKTGMRAVYAVRYEQEIGPIPVGLDMDHYVCNNGRSGCCNPRHVRPVTKRENTLRGNTIASQYAARIVCAKGHEFDGTHKGYRYCKQCKRLKK